MQDDIDASSVAALFAIARQIDLKALAVEMYGGFQLGVHVTLRDEPASRRRGIEPGSGVHQGNGVSHWVFPILLSSSRIGGRGTNSAQSVGRYSCSRSRVLPRRSEQDQQVPDKLQGNQICAGRRRASPRRAGRQYSCARFGRQGCAAREPESCFGRGSIASTQIRTLGTKCGKSATYAGLICFRFAG